MTAFSDSAKHLSKNPLGIIALNLVFIYGIAGAVLGFTSAHIPPEAIMALVWFIIGFPILVLFAFLYLVTWHHTKLYGPKDFSRPEDFTNLAYRENQWRPIAAPQTRRERI